MARPLHRQRARHCQHARLGAGGMDHARRSCPGVIRDHVQNRAAAFGLDHPLADGARTVKRSVEHDADDRVPSVHGELIGRHDEISGRIVDEEIDRAEFRSHRLDRLSIANIEHVKLPADFAGRFSKILFLAAREDHARAQAGELAGDGEADAGRTPGDDAGASVECFVGKHRGTLQQLEAGFDEVTEIAIVSDQGDVVIDAGLGDQCVCETGLMAGSLRACSQFAGAKPMTRRNVHHAKRQNERKDRLRAGIAEQFGDHNRRDNEVFPI